MKAFDTYTHINDLKKVGFREEQAAVIIRSLMDSREIDLANLATKDQVANIEKIMATKTDVAELRTELKEEIAELRTETKKDISGLRAEIIGVKDMIKDLQVNLVKWIVGLMIAFTGIILAGIQLIR